MRLSEKYIDYSLLLGRCFSLNVYLPTLIETLKEITQDYSLLYGYAAPAKAVTLLSLIDQEIKKKIEFIIEDNKLKQGHSIYKTEIPLKTTNEAIGRIKDRNSAYIIFTWNIFEEISKNNLENPKLN